MTKTIDVEENITIKTAIALIENGDEVVIEENGEPLAKLTALPKSREIKERVLGLGKGTVWMSDDFDDELPEEFWGLNKEL